jgi:hypothetical protein
VHDVHGRAQLAAEAQQQRDGLALPGRRARLEVRRIAARVSGGRRAVRRQLGVDEQRLAALGQDRQRGAQLGLAGRRKSSMPEWQRKAFTPRAPASSSRPSSPTLPGTRPPQNAQSIRPWPAATSRLRRSASRVVVTGLLLSGMSTSVVTPPAAAARVALSKPSQSVRPGSLTWTWLSTSPGSSTASPRSSTGVPGGTALRSTTPRIFSPLTRTAPGRSPSGVITRRLHSANSASGPDLDWFMARVIRIVVAALRYSFRNE